MTWRSLMIHAQGPVAYLLLFLLAALALLLGYHPRPEAGLFPLGLLAGAKN